MMKFELEQESWMLEGACSSMDSDLFFPIGSSMKAMKQIAEAKAVCNGCPVRIECLDEAKEIAEPFGIWGGLNEVERKRNLVFSD